MTDEAQAESTSTGRPMSLVGRKRGMTRVFTDDGASIPVTVIEAPPAQVVSVRETERDGYRAAQLAWGGARRKPAGKPLAGHYAKAGVAPAMGLYEHRLDVQEEAPAPGSEVTVAAFSAGQRVDVTGTTVGNGFAGVVRRYGFSRGGSSHGTSRAHRKPGSIGQCQTPGRVFKGKKMAGHMGGRRRTALNLNVVRVDAERNLLLIKGAVPGARGGRVVVRPAVRS